MLLKQIISFLEKEVPLSYQESYDNSGLQVGDINMKIRAALITIDVTEEVLDEAKAMGANLIISHHPVIFSGIKSLCGRNMTERILIRCIKNNIALYSMHTNLDAVLNGVNFKIAEKIGLKNCCVLVPQSGNYVKLSVFVPEKFAEKVRNAIFLAGGGNIGNYDNCSFNTQGFGTFKGNESTNPFAGEKNKLHIENEIKIETIVPRNLLPGTISEMIKAHPYEEVAYDVYPLENKDWKAGSGLIGDLVKPADTKKFLSGLKTKFKTSCIRHSEIISDKILKVAVCGGSGSFLLKDAIKNKADIFISSDFKYHQFFDAEKKILIADIGHYESEQYTKEIIYDLLIKNFSNFALRLSEINTNPINYI
jgi:dinuclear metal center YbgI/SA1388 family protein